MALGGDEGMRSVVFLAFNFVATIAVTFINKLCFSRVSFGFPAALCDIHFVMTWLGVEAMRRAGGFVPIPAGAGAPSLRDPQFAAIVIVVGLVTPLNNTSLKLNSVGFYQLFKLLVTPVVVALEWALDGRTLSAPRSGALGVVCACVFASSRADLAFSPRGTACAALWVPLAALYKVQWGRVCKRLGCSTPTLMHAVLPHALFVQLLLTPLVDPPGVLSFAWTRESAFWVGLSGVAAFAVNLSGFLVMANLGAIAHVLLGQLKTAAVCVGAAFLFDARYPPAQIAAAAGAVGGIVAYTHVTLRENQPQGGDAHARGGDGAKGADVAGGGRSKESQSF